MSEWELAIVVAVGGFPLAFVYWWSARPLVVERLAELVPDARQLIDRCRRRTLLLTVVPAVALAAWMLQTDAALPPGTTVWYPLVVFHLAWWLGVLPLVRADAQPSGMPGDVLATAGTGTRVRSASLAPREERDFLPVAWWLLPVGAFVAGVALIVWRVSRGLEQQTSLGIAVAGPLCAASFLIGYGWWARRSATGPQDVSGAVDPEALARAYDGYRRFLVRGIFGLMTAAVVVFVGSAVAVVLMDGDAAAQGRLGGWIGGGGGALVGILGGAFGTAASLRRLKLDRIRRHGSADRSVPANRATPA